MKVLVCGGRDYTDKEAVFSALDKISADGPIEIIQGGARGADTLAIHWAAIHNVPCQTFFADWKEHGLAAGPIRNRQMLTEGKPDLVVAFPGGPGTSDMIRQATFAKVKVLKIGAP